MNTIRSIHRISGITAFIITAICLCGCGRSNGPDNNTTPKKLGIAAFIAGNSPFYKQMDQMAHDAGLTVRTSFNSEYATYLPMARGHVLLVETQNGKPIVPPDLLEKFFPGIASGSHSSGDMVRVENTLLVFLDSSKPVQKLSLKEGDLKGLITESGPGN